MTDERQEDTDSRDEVPLDEKHWNALVFPGRVTLHQYEIANGFRVIDSGHILGRVGHVVTVRELVEGVHAAMQARYGDSAVGVYDGMLLSRQAHFPDMQLSILA